MAPSNDSIFDLGDKFGISSPFGDWLEKRPETLSTHEAARLNGKPSRYADQLQIPIQAPRTPEDGKESMLVLSDIVDPQPGIPGSAKISINMTYRLITEGEGEVHIRDQISTIKFKQLFAQGNMPDLKSKKANFLKQATLPSPLSPATELTREQLKLSKKLDSNGTPTFWNYYNVSVTYNFQLESREHSTFAAALTWMNDEIETRGIIFNLIYEKKCQIFHRMKTISIEDYRKTLSSSESSLLDESEIRDLMKIDKVAALTGYIAKCRSLLITQMIKEDLDSYIGSSIFLGEDNGGEVLGVYSPYRDLILMDEDVSALLSRINSSLSSDTKSIGSDDRPPVQLKGFSRLDNLMATTYGFNLTYYPDFLGRDDKNRPNVGALGSNPSLGTPIALVALNPYFFGPKAVLTGFRFPGLGLEELLVHECGHNLASEFVHKTGHYEYSQDGLQSNRSLSVYPSLDNTVSIINDQRNRINMRIS